MACLEVGGIPRNPEHRHVETQDRAVTSLGAPIKDSSLRSGWQTGVHQQPGGESKRLAPRGRESNLCVRNDAMGLERSRI